MKNVKLNAEKTDWLVSLFSLMVGIFVSSSIQGNFKNKANLQLEMVDRNLKIWLVDVDFQKAENISQLLTEKKPPQNITSFCWNSGQYPRMTSQTLSVPMEQFLISECL